MNDEPSTEIVPRWRSTIAETIDSPSPEPGCSEDSGARQKRSNSRSRSAGIGSGPFV